MGVVRWYKENNQAAFMGQVEKYNSEPQTLNIFPKSYINQDFSENNQILTLTSWICCANDCVGGLSGGQRIGLAELRGASPSSSQAMEG